MLKDTMSYEEKLQAVLNDPSIRYWVKDTIKELEEHDPVDALHDLELLLRIQKAKLDSYKN